MRWYVAHTRQNAEQRAVFNLTRQGFSAYLPQYRKRRRHARKVDTVLSPLFPRYVFVGMDPEVARWRSVNGTFGVQYLVCRGDEPAPVPDGFVEELMTHEDTDGAVIPVPPQFNRGDRVRILDGAMADQVGYIEQMADEERVFLLLDMLGREVRIRVPAYLLTAER